MNVPIQLIYPDAITVRRQVALPELWTKAQVEALAGIHLVAAGAPLLHHGVRWAGRWTDLFTYKNAYANGDALNKTLFQVLEYAEHVQFFGPALLFERKVWL